MGGMGRGFGGERASQVLILTTHDKERLGKAKLGRWVRNCPKPIGAMGRDWDRVFKPDLF